MVDWMDGLMDGWMDGWMDGGWGGWIDIGKNVFVMGGWMDGWVNACMVVGVDAWMCGRMYL
jgi:hypothetical protein